MADPPAGNEPPPSPPPPDASIVSEDAGTNNSTNHTFPAEQQWQWNAPPQHPAVAMAQYYEAQMRDHAAAYASAAAGAAWAAAQIAVSPSLPPALPQPPMYGGYEPQQQQQPWHPPPQASEEHARPGKRQQTMPAGVAAVWQHQQSPPRQPSRQDYRSSEKRGRRRMRSDTNSSDNSRGRPHQRKRSTDRTLLGKTGVSALHEWCDKRKMSAPQFNLHREEGGGFVSSVQVDGQERGRGRGGTKGSAKQDAARQAVQSLLPGTVFDDNGILVELPTSSSLGDLAPNLASRLAIGGGEESKKRQPSSRTWDVYPGTSTTSEEDNDYYASRGASVCSALLHALWQIDDGIPEPPSYTFELCTAAAKRKGVTGSTAIAVHRSSFACTARLIVKRSVSNEEDDDDNKNYKAESTNAANEEEVQEDQDKFHVETLTAVGTAVSKREARHSASAKLLAMLFPECNGMVEVKAAAEAAREKYAASKALKMQSRRVFAHEKRKLNDSGKLPRKRSIDFATPDESDPPVPLPHDLARQLRNLLGQEVLVDQDESLEADDDVVSVESLSLSEKAVPRDSSKAAPMAHIEESLARSLSRKKQLDARVDEALQTLNELDEEGRSLPEELNSNDVGRTVLRRAENEDVEWIQKLLANREGRPGTNLGPFSLLGVAPHSNLYPQTESESGNESLSVPSRLWASTAITLLLCRVISPKADPPLGCAVLTLGFSMGKGPTLEIAELVSEPHLPKERFIECLGTFASHMNCALDLGREAVRSDVSSRAERSESIYSRHQLKSILEAHLGLSQLEEEAASDPKQRKREAHKPQSEILDMKTIGTSLQSVQEEEAGEAEDEKDNKGEDTDAHRDVKGDKPCKRSRVV